MTDAPLPTLFERYQRVDDPARHDASRVIGGLRGRVLPPTLHDFEESARHYKASPDLVTAINMALSVGAPLLLTGEPGTGKTQVAYHLRWYFGIQIYPYQVRSTSTAKDLLYDFDAVGYLRNAYLAQQGVPGQDKVEFVTANCLWLAYRDTNPCVVLIDEIDKAPRDFPNDLLHQLDQHEFEHPLTKEPIRPASQQPPVIVITSNAERRLPDAFLRRCIVHHLELTEELVRDAVQARSASDFPHLNDDQIQAALERFWDLRDRDDLSKQPATAELLTWLTILSAQGTSADQIRAVEARELPGLGALIKDHEDMAKL